MKVASWDPRWDGELSEATMRLKLAELGYLVSRLVYKPGVEIRYPKSKVDKLITLLSGRFRVRLRGETLFLGAGDRLVIPKDVKHRANVVGKQDVVSMDAVRLGA